MSWTLVLPILIPIATAILAFGTRAVPALQRSISIGGSLALLLAAVWLAVRVWSDGIVAGQMGGWAAPFGITLVADLLSAIMVLITAIAGLAVAVYALADINVRLESLGFHTLYHVLIGGVCGAFLTGDVFNLYVWFEVMLIASFGLLVLGGNRAQLDGGIKYVALNLVSTILFLGGIGLLYGLTGTLNMADLHVAVQASEQTGLLTVVAVLFLVAFGIKSAVFPLFFWLPASYHTPPVAISAIFAGLLTKVGVYALIRTFTLIFTQDTGYTHGILLVVAALTMITGVLGAAAQNQFRKILSFHIISQIGYMVLGLALFTPLAIAGAVFYLVHHIIVKANLFLISGVVQRYTGSFELERIGGLYKSRPGLAILFLIPAFSLAGFPPLSGFWAKYLLVKASLDAEAYVIAGIALLVGLLTVFSMTKIWAEAFWKPHPDGELPPRAVVGRRDMTYLMVPVAGLAALTLWIGFYPEPFLNAAERSAAELLDPTAYVETVLRGAR